MFLIIEIAVRFYEKRVLQKEKERRRQAYKAEIENSLKDEVRLCNEEEDDFVFLNRKGKIWNKQSWSSKNFFFFEIFIERIFEAWKMDVAVEKIVEYLSTAFLCHIDMEVIVNLLSSNICLKPL